MIAIANISIIDNMITNVSRINLFPIQFPDIWDFHKKAQSSYWVVEEIVNLKSDIIDWNTRLNDSERHFIKYVLAFFAGSDVIVADNLGINFLDEFSAPEVKHFYGFQIAMENIHTETYHMLLDAFIEDKEERTSLYNATTNNYAISIKANWAKKWMDRNVRSLSERVIAFTIVEAILFSGSFCAIYWLKKRGLCLEGLCRSNELISRDEGLHADFGCCIYKYLDKVNDSVIHDMIKEAVDAECTFICEALPCSLIGMNSEMMRQYIKFVADRLCNSLGVAKIWNVTNPFDFMEMISVQGKANFFERGVSDYAKVNVMGGSNSFNVNDPDEDF